MLISATRLNNLPILDAETHQRVGVVLHCIFNPDLGKLAGLIVKPMMILAPTRLLSAVDILSYEQHAILSGSDSLSDATDLPRLTSLIKERRPILRQSVQTTTKKKLGRVAEVIFDDKSGLIIQIYVHGMFARRIFSVKDIVSVTKKAVIVKDDLSKAEKREQTEAVAGEVTTA